MKKILLWVLTFSLSLAFVACSGQQNIGSQSTDLGNSSEISTPDSEAGDDSELDNSSTEDTSSKEEDDNDSSSSVDSGNDSSNDDSASSDEWIDIVFPRM